jgi:hypothetical protein
MWIAVIIALAVPSASVVLVHVLVFAGGFHLSFSDHSRDWGDLGAYVGGTLGAVYGFLAIVGVLATLAEQDAQSGRDEIQSLLASHSQRIDSIFDPKPRQHQALFRERRANQVDR